MNLPSSIGAIGESKEVIGESKAAGLLAAGDLLDLLDAVETGVSTGTTFSGTTRGISVSAVSRAESWLSPPNDNRLGLITSSVPLPETVPVWDFADPTLTTEGTLLTAEATLCIIG